MGNGRNNEPQWAESTDWWVNLTPAARKDQEERMAKLARVEEEKRRYGSYRTPEAWQKETRTNQNTQKFMSTQIKRWETEENIEYYPDNEDGKLFYCKTCKNKLADAGSVEQHLDSDNHQLWTGQKREAAGGAFDHSATADWEKDAMGSGAFERTEKGTLRCTWCENLIQCESAYYTHCESSKHVKNVKWYANVNAAAKGDKLAQKEIGLDTGDLQFVRADGTTAEARDGTPLEANIIQRPTHEKNEVWCVLCEKELNTSNMWSHCQGKEHKKILERKQWAEDLRKNLPYGFRVNPDDSMTCVLCNKACNTSNYESHMDGKEHQAAVKHDKDKRARQGLDPRPTDHFKGSDNVKFKFDAPVCPPSGGVHPASASAAKGKAGQKGDFSKGKGKGPKRQPGGWGSPASDDGWQTKGGKGFDGQEELPLSIQDQTPLHRDDERARPEESRGHRSSRPNSFSPPRYGQYDRRPMPYAPSSPHKRHDPASPGYDSPRKRLEISPERGYPSDDYDRRRREEDYDRRPPPRDDRRDDRRRDDRYDDYRRRDDRYDDYRRDDRDRRSRYEDYDRRPPPSRHDDYDRDRRRTSPPRGNDEHDRDRRRTSPPRGERSYRSYDEPPASAYGRGSVRAERSGDRFDLEREHSSRDRDLDRYTSRGHHDSPPGIPQPLYDAPPGLEPSRSSGGDPPGLVPPPGHFLRNRRKRSSHSTTPFCPHGGSTASTKGKSSQNA